MNALDNIPFVRWFRYTYGNTPWLSFLLSSIIGALVINLVSERLPETLGWFWTTAIIACITFAIVLVAYFIFRIRTRRVANAEANLVDYPHPGKRSALILAPTSLPAAHKSVDYHMPALRHVWMLATPEMIDQGLCEKLRTYVMDSADEQNVRIKVYEHIPIKDAYATAECFDEVKKLLQEVIPKERVALADVAVDITGGTKPMTAAMVLACVATNNNILEHVPARYDNELKQPIPLTPIHVSFHFAQKSESPLPEE